MNRTLGRSLPLLVAVPGVFVALALTPCRHISSETGDMRPRSARASWCVYAAYGMPGMFGRFLDMRKDAGRMADAQAYFWGVLPFWSRWRIILPVLYFGAIFAATRVCVRYAAKASEPPHATGAASRSEGRDD